MELNKIIDFEGKRNSSFTFLIPPNSPFKKNISQIDKKIHGLKHENKKRQLKKVINRIKEATKGINRYGGNGMIICCGLNNNSEIEYYQIEPLRKISQIEYYYDYKFHINKIFESTFNTIDFIQAEEQKTWLEKLEALRNKELIVYEKEIDKYMELNLISTVLYFSNDIINLLFVNKSTDYNFQIKIFSFNSLQQKEIQNIYGKYIGILHYKVDWKI
jgi:hypothetical protein